MWFNGAWFFVKIRKFSVYVRTEKVFKPTVPAMLQRYNSVDGWLVGKILFCCMHSTEDEETRKKTERCSTLSECERFNREVFFLLSLIQCHFVAQKEFDYLEMCSCSFYQWSRLTFLLAKHTPKKKQTHAYTHTCSRLIFKLNTKKNNKINASWTHVKFSQLCFCLTFCNVAALLPSLFFFVLFWVKSFFYV